MSFLKIFFISLILISFLAGCSPTYPKAKVAQSVLKICKEEYKLDVQAKLIGKTIVVFLPLDELFDRNMDILPGVVEKIENVILSTSRVILSTDAKIDFYMVIVADTRTTAAELILVRYMEDVYKFMYTWITRDEYRKRVLWQVNFNPQHLKSPTFDFNLEEITLGNFLARQIAQRLTFAQETSKPFKEKVNGVYKKTERKFHFSLVVGGEKKFREVNAPIILHEAAVILQNYHFQDFELIEIFNLLYGQSVFVRKEELDKYLKIDLGKKDKAG